MRITGKLLLSVFVLVWFFLFLFIYLMSGALVGGGGCLTQARHHSVAIKAMLNDPSSLGNEEFIEKYLTLTDRVESLGLGERLMNSAASSGDNTPSNHVRKQILIGVITAEKYLLTRAVTIYDTWAVDLQQGDDGDHHLVFFVGEDCNTDDPRLKNMPIIKLPGIRDAVYPPQKKVFAVLEHFHHKFGGKFKWFIRADDDVYIHMRKLESMLQGWEWTEELMLGHPGYGLKKDRERLHLLPHENYCMGGPGVVFSASALKTLSPHLGRCLNAVEHHNREVEEEEGWFNEDVELGRCVSRTVGIGCSQVAKVRERGRGRAGMLSWGGGGGVSRTVGIGCSQVAKVRERGRAGMLSWGGGGGVSRTVGIGCSQVAKVREREGWDAELGGGG